VAFLRKSRSSSDLTDAVVEPEPAVVGGPKGRPTPKRRDSSVRTAGPVPKAPQNRKEAMAWQRQQRAAAKASPAVKMDKTEYRAAMRAGDEKVLPARDKGPVKSLARDYVDSRRMMSNFLFFLLPLVLLSTAIPALSILSVSSLVLLAIIFVEALINGRKIRRLAQERFGKVKESPLTLGFYCASRASMPRRWRLPATRVSLGDTI
jgi:hypothetical protein